MPKPLYNLISQYNIAIKEWYLREEFPNAALEVKNNIVHKDITSISIMSEQVDDIIERILQDIKAVMTNKNIAPRNCIIRLPNDFRIFLTTMTPTYKVLSIVNAPETLFATFQIAEHHYSYYNILDEMKNNLIFKENYSDDELTKIANKIIDIAQSDTIVDNYKESQIPFINKSSDLNNTENNEYEKSIDLKELPQFIVDDLNSYL